MASLFSTKPKTNTDYAHVWRRVHEVHGAKERIDFMWQEMQPYADSNFAREYRLHPYERSWELILGSTLLRRGFQLEHKSPRGPDFKVVDKKRFVWIEATAPSSGISCPDAIPVPPDNAMFDYPERQIILRIRGQIETKLKQFQIFVQSSSVSNNDCFVIAINGMQFHFIVDDDTSPAILKAVLPIGAPQIQINRKTGEVRESTMEYRPTVLKESGNEVMTTCFLNPAYSSVSAVLFSDANFLMDADSEWVNRSITVVHNPLATNPLPHGWFGLGKEIIPVINDDTVSWTITQFDLRE